MGEAGRVGMTLKELPLFTKDFFDSVLHDHVTENSLLKFTLDDGSTFDAQGLVALQEVILVKIQTERKKQMNTRFIPYERIRFVESIPIEKSIIDLFFNKNPENDFRQVPDNAEVRPLLKYNDLNLVRRALIALMQHGTVQGDRIEAVNLFGRMLRRVK